MAYGFDSINDILRNTTVPTDFGFPWTMAAWVFGRTDADFSAVLGVFDGTVSNNYWQLGRRNTDKAIVYIISPGGNVTATTAASIPDDEWSLILGTWISRTEVTATLISKNIEEINTVDDGGTGDAPSGHTRVGLGGRAHSVISNHFVGDIAECAMWSAILDEDEQKALFYSAASPLLIRPDKLRLYAPCVRHHNTSGVFGVKADLFSNELYRAKSTAAPTNVDHPRIIYPAAPFIVALPAAVAALAIARPSGMLQNVGSMMNH